MSRKNKKRKKKKQLPGKRISATKNPRLSGLPFDIDTELKRAITYHRSGRLKQAEKVYRRILRGCPDHPESLFLLGLCAHQCSNHDMASELMERAIHHDPMNSRYHSDLGNVYQVQGKWAEAISCYRKATQLNPEYAEAFYNMGSVFQDQGVLSETVSSYRKFLQLRSDYAPAFNNLGMALQDQGDLAEAMSCFQKAIQLRSDFVEAYNNLGIVLRDQGNLDEAVSCYREAVRLKPDFAEAYNNLGIALKDQGNLDEAISCYWKAVRLKPDFAGAYGQLIDQSQQVCAWQEMEDVRGKLDDLADMALDGGERVEESPFLNLTRCDDPNRNLAVAKSWSLHVSRLMESMTGHYSFAGRRRQQTKATIGYLSNDFGNHPVAHLLGGLFGLHNRNEFETLCYSSGRNDRSSYRAKIQQDADRFVDISGLSHVDAANRIYNDRVDILVDLMGHTWGNRLEICALRPAPIQVSYLGFLGSSGADFLDYIITDRIVTPGEHAQYYCEKFVYLPHSFQANDNALEISSKDWKKTDFGLPEEGFVFCSFNSTYKFEPVMFDLWMNLLHQVPDGVLWLSVEDGIAEGNLKRQAEARGVRPERLVFSKRLPLEEHLSRLRLADLALDTRTYNGGATTSNTLWGGVPVVTLLGNRFVSRMSASCLTAIGLPELIAHNLEEYEGIAMRLASNPAQLQEVRQKLAKNRLSTPLFDTPRFVRNLEKAYKEMWEVFLAGEEPRQIEVADTSVHP